MSETFHQLTTFMITQLTGFLQLRHRSDDRTEGLFVTHPTTMFTAVSTCLLYYLLHIALLLFLRSRFAVAAHPFSVCSAYAAVSTLAAAVFPDQASPFIYAVFGLLSAGELLHIFIGQLVIEDEEEKGEAAKSFEVCRRCLHRLLKDICSSLAEFFREQPPLPIPRA